MLVKEWKAWEERGEEGRAGTLVEGNYTRSSDAYSVGLMLLRYRPAELWQQDAVGQEFLNHLMGHEKTLDELLSHPWLEKARRKLPGGFGYFQCVLVGMLMLGKQPELMWVDDLMRGTVLGYPPDRNTPLQIRPEPQALSPPLSTPLQSFGYDVSCTPSKSLGSLVMPRVLSRGAVWWCV